ncbi:MAG: glucose-1-phosphate cytidylyltransferase [Lewinellaceae bacterium]|nr:glucose-1-phosphate cytidylyltransferase [Lewinellaceae bacterium]
MKTMILAGGYGSRLSEETDIRPKPMVEIGGKPILWHIMKIYSHYGFNDFIILCGYKGYVIKEYFANYFLHHADLTFDLANNQMKIHHNPSEPWTVTLLDTGLDTMTGGRVLRAKPYLQPGEPFMLTYGDGVSDINIPELINFHQSHGKAITMTSSQPEGRFGALDIGDGGKVGKFVEKPKGDGAWINAGFFVCEHKVFDYIQQGDETIFERAPLENLANDGELFTYRHYGFWRPMDTLRDKQTLDRLWTSGEAKWNIWK